MTLLICIHPLSASRHKDCVISIMCSPITSPVWFFAPQINPASGLLSILRYQLWQSTVCFIFDLLWRNTYRQWHCLLASLHVCGLLLMDSRT